MKYLFILGRNPGLSEKEVLSYLKRFEKNILSFSRNGNALLVEIEETLDGDAINFLGGVLRIGIVLADGNSTEVCKSLDSQEIYYGTDNKLNYVLWDFSGEAEFFGDYLKERFRRDKLKATEKSFTGNLELQDGGKMKIVGSRNVKEEFFVFSSEGKTFFGRIVQKCDYENLEERDMLKPVRREGLAISPRLAKIMINLSEISEEGNLLDPFCGIGVVLQEATLQNLKVKGIDKDSKAIDGAKKNLEWLKISESKFEVVSGDSRKININEFDVIVSEPDLGTLRIRSVKDEIAKMQLRNFEKLLIDVLNNFKGKISDRIVLTSPYIRTLKKKRLGANFKRIAEKTCLKIVKGFPIAESRKNQIVGREIIVFKT